MDVTSDLDDEVLRVLTRMTPSPAKFDTSRYKQEPASYEHDEICTGEVDAIGYKQAVPEVLENLPEFDRTRDSSMETF